MADRYWVGGNGTWDASNATNWSTSSGGTGGATAPTSIDNVFFDNNSGVAGNTVVIGTNAVCSSFYYDASFGMNFSGSSDLSCHGTTFRIGVASMSTLYIGRLKFFNTTSCNISGQSYPRKIVLMAGAKLNSSLLSSSGYVETLTLEDSSVLTIKENLKVANAYGSAISTAPTINVGASGSSNKILTLVGTYPTLSGSIVISNLFGGKVVMTGELGDSGCSGFNIYLQSLELNPSISDRIFKFGGSVTILTLSRSLASLPFTIQIDPSANMQVSSFAVSGDSGTTIKVESSVPGVRAKITKTSGGLVETNYMRVTDMQPAPDNTWISYNSINAGNNWQWYFDNFNKPTSCLFFGSHV